VDRYRFFVKWKKSLETRCNLIIDGLWSMSINAEKIWTAEIINLLFRCYNPLLHSSTAKL
jgi:hypothetical protein